MDPDNITPQQTIASLASIAPFLWPFVLLSLGVSLTPVSPISWSYSTWLLYIIPLIITIFAPIRRFSGPLRFAYLEYASKIASWAVSLLKVVLVNFQSIPTLALPALFVLPVLPILFFVIFPALPVIWHYIAYHYRRRLNVITTSVAEAIASLDLAIDRARQAIALAHTYEKQALCTVSTNRGAPLIALSQHSTDFSTPELNQGIWRLVPNPGTFGADLAGKVLDTEKQMAAIEDASQGVRTLSENAVAVATEGDMVAGEKLAEETTKALKDVVKRVGVLHSTADQARFMWVDFRRRLNKVTSSTSTTTANLDLAIDRAKQALALAHTYEKQAMYTVSTTRGTPLLDLSRHSTDFGTPESNQGNWRLIPRPGTLGASLAGKVLDTEKKMAEIEDASQKVRSMLERAVMVATEGDIVEGETLAENAKRTWRKVVKQVDVLCSTADQARCIWVDFRRSLDKITSSTSTITANLDPAIARARQALALAHSYEKQALYTVSTTRGTPSLAVSRHSTDFVTPDFSHGQWRLIQGPGTLGAHLAEKVLDTEKQMAAIEDASQNIRTSLERAIKAATEGNMVLGDELAEDAVLALKDAVKRVNVLCSTADQARYTWVEFRRCLNKITSSASKTTASLELAVTQARRADTLAHTYEKQALAFVSTTRRTASQTLALYDADFFERSVQVQQARQTIANDAEMVRRLGTSLKDTMLLVEAKIGEVEYEADSIRSSLEQAVMAAVDGDVKKGEKLADSAADSLKAVVNSVEELCSTSDDVHQAWIELSVKYWAIP